MGQPTGSYDTTFFESRRAFPRNAAHVVVPLLLELTVAKSVVDFGCGTGEWLLEFSVCGVTDILGLDGDYVDRTRLVIAQEAFRPTKLHEAEPLERQFDLAISVEVAEHLPRHSSERFVAMLTSAAPIVAFSAAVPGQGGVGHINCQWPSFWMKLFEKYGYVATDPLRSRIWKDNRVANWYQQNLFVFVRREIADTVPWQNALFKTGDLTLLDSELAWRAPTVREATSKLIDATRRSIASRASRIIGRHERTRSRPDRLQ